MNKFDDNAKMLCDYVSKLFEFSSIKKDISSNQFIKKFSNSKIAEAIYNKTIIISNINYDQAYNQIITKKTGIRKDSVFPTYIMAWIGYMMEYISYTRGYTMYYIYTKVPPSNLYMLYEAYHSMDNELAAKRIIESYHLDLLTLNKQLFKNIYEIK